MTFFGNFYFRVSQTLWELQARDPRKPKMILLRLHGTLSFTIWWEIQ